MANQELSLEDLNYLYVNVPRDGSDGDILLTVPEMSDRQFREWIVAKGQMHGFQILPTFGRLGVETRLALVNHLVRRDVRIYIAPRNPMQA